MNQHDQVRHRNPIAAWFTDRGWTLLVHALLIVLAMTNLYPFLWMSGTSTKALLESSANIDSALPMAKYGLSASETRSLLAPFRPDGSLIELADEARTEEAKAECEAFITKRSAAETAAADINQAQAALLERIRRRNVRNQAVTNTFVPYYEDPANYAKTNSYKRELDDGSKVDDIGRARAEMDDLVARGLLKQVRFQIENYTVVWTDMAFWLHTATSFVVTSAVVIIVVLMSSMLGFALARLSFPGKLTILMLLLIGSVAPAEAVIIPVFRFIMAAGLLDSLWGMVLWMSGISIGNAFLMAGFFMTLPKEVEEAAFVDGAGPFRTFFAIALPMAKPIVMTVGLLAFLGAWNNFLVPLLTAQSRPEFQPLALAVYMFKSGYESHWHWVNAAATIMVLPVVLLFIFLQRFIVNAIAVGAVKG